MKIEFDSTKDAANREKHKVSLGDADKLDWSAVVGYYDTRREYGEIREVGFGLIGKRLYCVVFTRRGNVARIISFRRASKREVKRYGSQGS